jgi:hypothetical protein
MPKKHWAWVAAVGVLVAGITNAHAHIHLCFDGHEPPAALHLAGDDDHDRGHDLDDPDCSGDVDVDLQNQAVAKTVKHDSFAIDPPVLRTLAFEDVSASPLPVTGQLPPRPPPLYTHPPLRAPPR